MAFVAARRHCCWCNGDFIRIGDHYWCESAACREQQAKHSIAIVPQADRHPGRFKPKGWVDPATQGPTYLFVPLPRQVMFDACMTRYLLGGGAAGSTKSHAARWGMYRRALAITEYEGLLLRRTWDELNKHHFRLMDREAAMFRRYGFDVHFSITNREMTFPNGSVIEGGHMENPDDVSKYLSRERDEIVCDEGSTFDPKSLLGLSTRARSSKPQVLAAGFRGLFRVFTNPGGPASSMLRDMFIDHDPNWEDFPPEFKDGYNPAEWTYIPGNLEDNPYLPPDYERDLMVESPWRFKQLRYNDWDAVAGHFFHDFDAKIHVQDLGDPGENVEWFRSMDWGYLNPGDVLWWACLPDNRFYIRREHKFSHKGIPEVKEDICKISEEIKARYVRYTVCDPSMGSVVAPISPTNVRTFKGFEGETIMQSFGYSPNSVPLIRGDNDRYSGWQRIREFLRIREDGQPSLIIHPSCRYLIRSMAQAVAGKRDPEDIDTNTDDHALDTLRYGAMSMPSPTLRKKQHSGRTFDNVRKDAARLRRQLTVR